MKTNALFTARILIILLFSFLHENEVFPQNNLPENWKLPGMFFGIGSGLTYSNIINKGTQSVTNTANKEHNNFISSFEAGYFFSECFGLISGVNYYSSISSYCRVEDYQNKYNTVDIENDFYELRVTGYDFKETQHIEILSIPLYFGFRKQIGKKTGLFFQPGINLFIPLKSKFQSQGTFTYKGFFPKYNVLLEDLPEHGFESTLISTSAGKVDLKRLSFGPSLSAGIDLLIQKRLQLALGGYYDRTLTSISNYSSPDELLTSETSQINNTLSGSNETKFQSLGIKLSIRYYLTDFKKFKYYFHNTPKENLREYERMQN